MNKWTTFWDMHSGGGCKEEPYDKIFIEAPEEEAKVIFFNRFGHNPERVSCTCCGEDYSISEDVSLEQATGYHRNCRTIETPRDPKTGLYKNDDPIIKDHLYLEDGEEPPSGYKVDTRWGRYSEYQTLDEYIKNPNVLVIYAKDIKPEERQGVVPDQGYVWVD